MQLPFSARFLVFQHALSMAQKPKLLLPCICRVARVGKARLAQSKIEGHAIGRFERQCTLVPNINVYLLCWHIYLRITYDLAQQIAVNNTRIVKYHLVGNGILANGH